jgi:hypothetical protein
VFGSQHVLRLLLTGLGARSDFKVAELVIDLYSLNGDSSLYCENFVLKLTDKSQVLETTDIFRFLLAIPDLRSDWYENFRRSNQNVRPDK